MTKRERTGGEAMRHPERRRRAGPAPSVEVVPGLDEVDAAAWDALVPDDEPFLGHAFLRALETSGSVGPGTGWQPAHLVVRQAGRLVAALPAYVKGHGWGEYIFDWSWADAAERAGIDYYPKLVVAAPFTPVTGRRFLTAPDGDRDALFDLLAAGARALADELALSSIHVLFCAEEERERLATHHGWLPRTTSQFHWENRGWPSFDAYLADFRSSARKNVRKERRRAAAAELRFETLRGDELDDRRWRALLTFYRDTVARKGAIPYLTPSFFAALRERLADQVLATFAVAADGTPQAGALSFQKGRHLYGRYWGRRGGAAETHDALHFELCYYRPLDACLANGWTRFEAGAQGIHKLKRGLLPAPTYSAHWLRDPALRDGVARFLAWEREAVAAEIADLAAHGPFRCDD